MLSGMWFFASSSDAGPNTWHQVPAFDVEGIRIQLLAAAGRRQSYLLPVFDAGAGRETRVTVFPHLTPEWVLFEHHSWDPQHFL